MNAMEKNRERDIPNNYIIDNKYIILEKIDEGGFAKIYLTKKIDTDEQYAIKVLKKGKTPNIEILSFLKEIEILTILTKSDKENKYIPHLYDSGKTNVNRAQNNKEVKLYYTTDYIQNKTLYEYVIVSKGFSERHTKYILSKILKGVKYCHDAGICHLDLHLKNILLDKNY
jgi:serine/threonine protein kinase